MSERTEGSGPDPGAALLELYDEALPQVYGYVRARCGHTAVAEDITAETFLSAVTAVRRGTVPALSVAWLIGVARHKLADHWRRQAREERSFRLVEESVVLEDPWDDERFDALLAHEVLARLGAHHRAALTLRYLDGLPVPEVAALLGRSLHATEALLVRARSAFRRTYGEVSGDE